MNSSWDFSFVSLIFSFSLIILLQTTKYFPQRYLSFYLLLYEKLISMRVLSNKKKKKKPGKKVKCSKITSLFFQLFCLLLQSGKIVRTLFLGPWISHKWIIQSLLFSYFLLPYLPFSFFSLNKNFVRALHWGSLNIDSVYIMRFLSSIFFYLFIFQTPIVRSD